MIKGGDVAFVAYTGSNICTHGFNHFMHFYGDGWKNDYAVIKLGACPWTGLGGVLLCVSCMHCADKAHVVAGPFETFREAMDKLIEICRGSDNLVAPIVWGYAHEKDCK